MVENNSPIKYRCELCNKNYKDKSGLWYHNNKYHLIPDNKMQTFDNIPDNKMQTFDNKKEIFNNRICKFCNKVFSHRNSRWKHEQKCNIKINNDQIMELKKELTNEIKEVRELKEQLKEKINNTQITKNSNNTTNTNTTNNTNKGTINNNYIIAFGKEEINNILTEKEKIRILNARYKSLEESIKAIHFNKDRPEYQNIVITNMRDNLVHIFDGKKFVSQAKHGTINQLIDNHMESIEESLDNSREKLNPKTVDIIEKLIEKINDETTELYDEENDKKYLNYKNYKNDLVKLFVYNESDNKKPSISLVNKKKKEIDL
jgi:hypothetical protein